MLPLGDKAGTIAYSTHPRSYGGNRSQWPTARFSRAVNPQDYQLTLRVYAPIMHFRCERWLAAFPDSVANVEKFTMPFGKCSKIETRLRPARPETAAGDIAALFAGRY
jgi:hypothetical protein